VLQTTAGKMIFGKFDERGPALQPVRPAEPARKPAVQNSATPAAPAVAAERPPE